MYSISHSCLSESLTDTNYYEFHERASYRVRKTLRDCDATCILLLMTINADLQHSPVKNKTDEEKGTSREKSNWKINFFLMTNVIKVTIRYIVWAFYTLNRQAPFTRRDFCLFFCLLRVVTKLFCCQGNLTAQISLRMMNVSETRGLCQRIVMYDNFAKCRAGVTLNFVHHAQSCESNVLFLFETEGKLQCTANTRANVISSALSLPLRICTE